MSVGRQQARDLPLRRRARLRQREEPGLRRAVGQGGVGAHDGVPGQAPLIGVDRRALAAALAERAAERARRMPRSAMTAVPPSASPSSGWAPRWRRSTSPSTWRCRRSPAHFRLALGDVQWLVICYVLVYGSLMLVCGKLGDLFGHRLIFRIGLLISAVGCAACAAAPDWPLFLWARAGQGVGTALALSCTPALATSLFPESDAHARPGGLRAWRCRSPPRSARSWAASWSSCGAGPRSTGCACRSRSSTLALSGLLPSPKPDPRPFDARGRGAARRLHERAAAVAGAVAAPRGAGLWVLGAVRRVAGRALRLCAARAGACPSRSSGRRCSPIPPSPSPTS